MKKGTTASASYLFVLEECFRNEEEDQECTFGGILRIDSSQAFCGHGVLVIDDLDQPVPGVVCAVETVGRDGRFG